MKKHAGHKLVLFLVLAVTAAVLCALPFFLPQKPVVCVYTSLDKPEAKQLEFVKELKRLGYKVKLNSKDFPQKGEVGLWFKNPEFAYKIENSSAEYNFLYSKEHYPFEWYGMKKIPVVLTPYVSLYEHYMRTNIKVALFDFEKKDAAASANRLDVLLKWLRNNKY